MSKPTIFLAVTIGSWVALRLATASLFPGALARDIDPQPMRVATQTAPAPSPVAARTVYVPYPVYIERAAPPPAMAAAARYHRPTTLVAPVPATTGRRAPAALPPTSFALSGGGRPYSIIATALPPPRAGPRTRSPTTPPHAFDRWQLTSWALFRDDSAAASLAPGGMLGGSQAGTRLTYRFDERLALAARLSGPVGDEIEGGEAALGVRYKPFANIPFALTAERRQRLGPTGGRNDFALFAEGGIWDQPLPAQVDANGYLQAGVVGIEERDLFIDGSLTLTRPLIANIDGGIGVWGGAQPGLTRLDVGPRLSMPLHDGVRLHLDWRQKVAGDADPGSGPVLSLGADF